MKKKHDTNMYLMRILLIRTYFILEFMTISKIKIKNYSECLFIHFYNE